MEPQETFEVCILKFDGERLENQDKIYKIRDALNVKYSVIAGGELVRKFIVIPHSVFNMLYLTYVCCDLEEAARYRAEAKEIYKTL